MRQAFCIFILFYCIPILAQAPQEKPSPSLEATTYIIEQKDCITDSGMAADGRKIVSVRVDLVLKVQYKNIGLIPLIIHQGSGTVGSDRIAFTIEDAQQKAYSYKTNNYIVSSVVDENGNEITPPKDESLSPSKNFVVINPSDSYEGKSQTRLLFDLPNTYQKFDNRTGYLQLGLWTMDGVWSQSNKEEDVRTRWQKYGYLWTKGVTSQPMPIQFLPLSTITKCNPN